MKAQLRESQIERLDEMQFSLRASSTDRLWAGMEAATYEISAGVVERPPAASHILVMHLSAPVAGTARCGGPTLMRVMDPGDMDFVPVGHAATWLDRSPGRVLNVRLAPSFVQSTAATLGARGAGAVDIAPQLHFRDAALEHLARALVIDLESGDTRDRLFAESVGTAMAAQLLQRYGSVPPARWSGGFSRGRLRAVVGYIEENLGENFGLADLADVAGLSPSHFKAIFKQAMGMPVHQYVIRQRVDLAVRLIARGGTRLCEVAQEAGFAHQSHLARCMRRVLGTTPGVVARRFR